MRLLVHGGTSYNERQRVGEWSSAILPGTLEDTYCLSKDSFAFGVGLQGGEPFLIARTLVSHKGRPYALSVLLDPGVDVWTRFRWNAGHLALALFGLPVLPGRLLMDHAEAFNSSSDLKLLMERLESLTDLADLLKILPPDEQPRAAPPSDFLGLLVGAGAIHTTDMIVATPEMVGLSVSPSLAEMAVVFDRLPIAFRIGQGWLVNGGKTHGEVFSTHLVLDAGMAASREATGPAVVSACISEGRQLLDASESVRQHKVYGQVWATVAERPIREWGDNGIDSPPAFFADLRMLASLLDVETPPGTILASIMQRLNHRGPLDQALTQALLERLWASPDELSAEATDALLWLLGRGAEVVDEQTASRVNVAAAVQYFVTHWPADPSGMVLRLRHFPAAIRAAVWRDLMPDASAPHHLLRQALEDLNAQTAAASASEEQIREVISAAVKATGPHRSLQIWNEFGNEPQVWPLLETALEQESRERAKSRETGWPEDYLAFANDEGGLVLDDNEIDGDGAHEMVQYLCKEASNNAGRLTRQARDWLDMLALSPLRKRVSIQDKIRIASIQKLANWGAFSAVHHTYEGYQLKGHADETEKAYLIDELRDLVERDREKTNANVPNLADIVWAFPEDDLRFFSQLSPKLSWQDYAKWVSPWQNIDQRIYQRELRRVVIEQAGKPIPNKYELTLQDDLGDQLAEVLSTLFFRGTERDDERFDQCIGKLFDIYIEDDRFNESLAEAFERNWDDAEKQAVFKRRQREAEASRCIAAVSKNLSSVWQQRLEEARREWKEEEFQRRIAEFSDLLYGGDSSMDGTCRREVKEMIRRNRKGKTINKEFKEMVIAALDRRRESGEGWQTFTRRFGNYRDDLNGLLVCAGKEIAKAVNLDIATSKDAKLHGTISKWLYQENKEYDEDYRNQLADWLVQRRDPAFLNVLAAALEEGLQDEVTIRAISRRYAWKKDFLDKLFLAIPPELQQYMIVRLCQINPKQFQEEAENVCTRALRDATGLGHYRLRLLCVLREKPEVRKAKQRVGKVLLGDEDQIDIELDYILESNGVAGARGADGRVEQDGRTSSSEPADDHESEKEKAGAKGFIGGTAAWLKNHSPFGKVKADKKENADEQPSVESTDQQAVNGNE